MPKTFQSRSTRRTRQPLCLLGSVAIAFGLVATPQTGTAQIPLPDNKCYPEAPLCTGGAGGCIGKFASFPALSSLASAGGEGYMRGGKCGVDRMLNPCGNHLGNIICEASGGGHSCDCGPGIGPCVIGPEGGGAEGNVAAAPSAFSSLAPRTAESRAVWERMSEIASKGVPQQLASIWNELAALQSIYLRARVEVWKSSAIGPGGREMWGAGTFEYWEQGERYRAASTVPLALGLSQFSDLSFDGNIRLLHLAQDGITTVRKDDPRAWAQAFRNPLTLSVFFLNPFDQQKCPLCELRLNDLKVAAPRIGQQRASTSGVYVLEVPVSKFGSRTERFVKILAAKQAEQGSPSGFERITDDGTVLERVRLEHFNPVKGHTALRFPWTLTYEMFDDDGSGPLQTVTYKIEAIEANRFFDPSIFRFSVPGARIWDDEARVFIPAIP